MRIFAKINEMRTWHQTLNPRERLAFVPTMGNLHAGHISLIKEAKASAEHVIASIFVNRLQFAEGEDFGAYPRTFDEDCHKLNSAGVDAVFCPSDKELFPDGRQSFYIELPAIKNELCGEFRDGHFRGVATIICKLFNIVQPDIAVFGRKDYQQLHIIKAMVEDLNIPVQIVPVRIARAEDGLALSSRNGYLSEQEREQAPFLFAQLQSLKQALLSGQCDYAAQISAVRNELEKHGWQVDYVELREAKTLAKVSSETKHMVALAAAKLGRTRLIDNLDINLI